MNKLIIITLLLILGLYLYAEFLNQNELDNDSTFENCTYQTKHCESKNTNIVVLSESLTKDKKTAHEKAVAIFGWVQAHISYEYYDNSRYGAAKCLQEKKCNCCDQANLVNALMRAAGLPAKYEHGVCHFYSSDKDIGHVWSEIYIDGKWYVSDTTSSKNKFGEVNSWRLVKHEGEYCELPF